MHFGPCYNGNICIIIDQQGKLLRKCTYYRVYFEISPYLLPGEAIIPSHYGLPGMICFFLDNCRLKALRPLPQ